MASEAQILANPLNAPKSTGPRTAEGKAAVWRNAVKHGLTARSIVVTGEDPGESPKKKSLRPIRPATGPAKRTQSVRRAKTETPHWNRPLSHRRLPLRLFALQLAPHRRDDIIASF